MTIFRFSLPAALLLTACSDTPGPASTLLGKAQREHNLDIGQRKLRDWVKTVNGNPEEAVEQLTSANFGPAPLLQEKGCDAYEWYASWNTGIVVDVCGTKVEAMYTVTAL